MKFYHFALLFLLFFLGVVIKTDLSIGKLKVVENEKLLLQNSLDSAMADAAEYLASSGRFGTNSIDKEGTIQTFFTSLYTSMGIISDTDMQAEVETYIPVILLCDVDGYYVYYYDEYKLNGSIDTKRVWTEKTPYYQEDRYFNYRFTLSDRITINDKQGLLGSPLKVYEMDYHEVQTQSNYKNFRQKYGDCMLFNDESFELTKKGSIIDHLEDVLSYYTNRYNFIAHQNGITYNFSFPSGQTDEWAQYMDDVNLLVVFQGYPYGNNSDYTFNKVSSAGANLIKKPVYYIEQKSWYNLAHKAGCPKLKNCITLFDDTYDSIEECAKLGAYCCEECIEHGARAPEVRK